MFHSFIIEKIKERKQKATTLHELHKHSSSAPNELNNHCIHFQSDLGTLLCNRDGQHTRHNSEFYVNKLVLLCCIEMDA